MRLVWLTAALVFGSMVTAGTLFVLSDGDVVTFAKRADDLIDARMAATLAGLALAAASFTRDTPRRPEESDDSYRRRHDRNLQATRLLVRGFYVFTGVLAMGLSFDPLFDPKPVRAWADLIGWAEFVGSAAGISVGLGFLVAGAHDLLPPTADDE